MLRERIQTGRTYIQLFRMYKVQKQEKINYGVNDYA